MTETKKKLIELLGEGLLRGFTNVPCEEKLVITPQNKCPVQTHFAIKTLRHSMSTTYEERPLHIITLLSLNKT